MTDSTQAGTKWSVVRTILDSVDRNALNRNIDYERRSALKDATAIQICGVFSPRERELCAQIEVLQATLDELVPDMNQQRLLREIVAERCRAHCGDE